jgi:hypothetical protein
MKTTIAEDKKVVIFALSFLFLSIAVCSALVLADVSPPTVLTFVRGSRFNTSLYPAKNVSAIAGNVTELTITGSSPTKAWQGFYGNITGTLVLEDSSGNVFYNWSVAEPKGTVFASPNSSISFSSIKCFNFTANGSSEINLTGVEGEYNINTADVDGINETFNSSNPSTFYVGATTIAAGSCPATFVFQNGAYQVSNFINVLLTDSTNLVFSTIIENKQTNVNTDLAGYNGVDYDFQLLVAEDGHGSDTSTTSYYFWVELK